MNQLALMLTAYLALVGQPDNLRPVGDDEWQSYKLTYDKSYENQQIESLRRSVYAVNKAKLETKQTQLKQSNASYEIGINKFTDWTEREAARFLGSLPSDFELPTEMSAEDESYVQMFVGDDPAPDEFDWRKQDGRVSGVKDQGLCSSNWAFATTGALEGQQLERQQNFSGLVPLSEQNLMDCIYAPYSFGCQGAASVQQAFDYVRDNGGIESEKSYPYLGYDDQCHFEKSKCVIGDRGHVDLLFNDEQKLKKFLVGFGPVTVTIHATGLLDYRSGVFSNECNDQIESAVLLVGYGKDPKLGDFWIVKNSWGESWGEKGYFRLARGKNAACINKLPSVPKF